MSRHAMRFIGCSWLVVVLAGCAGETPRASAALGPYYFPHHPNGQPAPLGLAEGILAVRSKCLYLDDLLLIWPDAYAVTRVDGRGAIVGDGWTAFPGQRITVGGGQYDDLGSLPSGRRTASMVPCPGPYLRVSEIIGVEPSPAPAP